MKFTVANFATQNKRSPAQRGWDSYIVYLFDKSITTYSGPFSARQLSDKVHTIGELVFINFRVFSDITHVLYSKILDMQFGFLLN